MANQKKITDEKEVVVLNENHGHQVCPACNGRSAGVPNYGCKTCDDKGTIAPTPPTE